MRRTKHHKKHTGRSAGRDRQTMTISALLTEVTGKERETKGGRHAAKGCG